MTTPTELIVSAATHVGRVRQNNQDCGLVGNWCGFGPDECHSETYSFGAAMYLCMVADGVGGHNSGEVASQLAIRSLKEQLENVTGSPDIQSPDTQSIVEKTALAVFEQSISRPEHKRMGTTIVGAQFMPDRSIEIFNVGDSRAYLFQDGTLSQLSVDDTMKTGQGDGASHVLTQAIGGSDTHQIPQIHIRKVPPVQADGILMLCSDGLYNMVSEQSIAAELAQETPNAASNLVRMAVENGGRDNVTTIVAKFSTTTS